MSICLIGKSCSGKDTVTKELISMGYEKIITYTTRPQRNGEIDGIHYHFISEKLFKKMIEDIELSFLKFKSTIFFKCSPTRVSFSTINLFISCIIDD